MEGKAGAWGRHGPCVFVTNIHRCIYPGPVLVHLSSLLSKMTSWVITMSPERDPEDSPCPFASSDSGCDVKPCSVRGHFSRGVCSAGCGKEPGFDVGPVRGVVRG